VFEANVDGFGDGGGALCVYVDGVKVVDVWAGEAKPGVAWKDDTLATIMSSTKGLTALCAQILYDRGLLDIDAPVSEYWPEFAQAGKDKALVRHILNHTVGVLAFPGTEDFLDLDGSGWDQLEEIAARLAATPPAWEPGTRTTYHALTCGWLTGELIRRITGKTVGTFLETEVTKPLDVDIWIGTPVDAQQRLADVIDFLHSEDSPEMVTFQDKVASIQNDPATILGQLSIPSAAPTCSTTSLPS
jgi:CubicO group peptidase (beta-lactamase class C family)